MTAAEYLLKEPGPESVTEAEHALKNGCPCLRFPKRLEKGFLSFYYTYTIKRVRFAILIGAALCALFGHTNALIVTDQSWYTSTGSYTAIVPLGLMLFAASRSSFFQRYMQPLLCILTLTAGLGILAMAVATPTTHSTFYYSGLILVLMYALTFVGMRFWYGLTCTATIVTTYLVLTRHFIVMPQHIFIPTTFCLIAAAFIGLFSNYLMECHTRRDFLKTVLLEAEKLELQEQGKILQWLSVMDELTGIANRRHFENVFEQEWSRAQRNQSPLSLLMIDVDHFKCFNDNYGHQAGDECLKLVAESIKNFARRPGDLVARYGGEEFAVILENTELTSAYYIAELIRHSVADLRIPHAHGESQVVTLSIGIATIIPTGESSRFGLITSADQAMYQAKRTGRNKVTPYKPSITSDASPFCTDLPNFAPESDSQLSSVY